MLLSDRWRIIKTTNSDFKDEEDFSSCKSDKNVQLERVKSDNLNNFDDVNDENSSSNEKNKNVNADENEILSLSSSNSLMTVSQTELAFMSTNSTKKN